VRLAGIGAVATLKSHRGRGLMARTAGDSVRGMDAAGYDASLLFGIPGFYHRFGYVCAFSQVRVVLKTRDLVPANEPVEYALYEGPVTELAELYNRDNEGVTGTFVRPTYRINRMPARFSIYRFGGGYVVGGSDGTTYQVADCAGDPATVVEVARQRARADVCPEIEFAFTPPRSQIGEHLRSLTHRTISDRHRGGGPMMKIVNLVRLLEKIAPELSARLSASPLQHYSGSLALHGETSALVRISEGTVTGITGTDESVTGGAANGTVMAGPSLARLIIGDGDPRRVCRQDGIEVSGDAHHLVPILFPDQEPSTILWDRF
jgi:hypothetical protein